MATDLNLTFRPAGELPSYQLLSSSEADRALANLSRSTSSKMAGPVYM
jgi:hypothetical protein